MTTLQVSGFVMLGDDGAVFQTVDDHVAVGAVASIIELEHNHHSRDVVDNHVRFRILETEESITLSIFDLNESAHSVLVEFQDVAVNGGHHVGNLGMRFDVGKVSVSIPLFKQIPSRNLWCECDYVDRKWGGD